MGDVQLGLPGEILVDDVRGRDSDLVTPVAHLADVAHDGVLGDDRRHAAFGQHVGRDVVIKLEIDHHTFVKSDAESHIGHVGRLPGKSRVGHCALQGTDVPLIGVA